MGGGAHMPPVRLALASQGVGALSEALVSAQPEISTHRTVGALREALPAFLPPVSNWPLLPPPPQPVALG